MAATKKKEPPTLDADRYEEEAPAWAQGDGGGPTGGVAGHYAEEHLLLYVIYYITCTITSRITHLGSYILSIIHIVHLF